MKPWPELEYWNIGEWDVVQERLEDTTRRGLVYCPGKGQLFRALRATSLASTKVAFIGQDPFPNPMHATGLAFSIPPESKTFPPTLLNLLSEYGNDLGYPVPLNGDLSAWASRGVLLWNAIPSCEAFKSASHRWVEWELLTEEICQKLSDKGGVPFVLFGSIAHHFAKVIDTKKNKVILVSHPSPRATLHSKYPFTGSRIFSSVNGYLCDLGKEPIDWRL